MIEVREAQESDVNRIREIFLLTYGWAYAHPEYYDPQQLKRMVFDDNTLLLVAEDTESNVILGTASVLLEVGSHEDLLGEFGRLAVKFYPLFTLQELKLQGDGWLAYVDLLCRSCDAEVLCNGHKNPELGQRHKPGNAGLNMVPTLGSGLIAWELPLLLTLFKRLDIGERGKKRWSTG